MPPDGVVFAQSTDEVATVVGLCHEHKVPIVAYGTGTSLKAICTRFAAAFASTFPA